MNTNRIWSKLKRLGVLWILWHCVGCEREYLRYDTGMKDAIYMFSEDTMYYSFVAGAPETEYDYLIYLEIMGTPKSYERTYRIEVVDSLTTAKKGIHYQLSENNTFPKDVVKTKGYITLFKDKDPGLREEPVVLVFRLVESEDFNIVPLEGYATEIHLFINVAAAPRPMWWSEIYLGDYTEQAAFMFMKFFHEMKEKNPIVYQRLVGRWGENLQYANFFFWLNDVVVLKKYVLRPLYDYYQAFPDPEVNIPNPQF